ncbi:MAG TPA: hypothetical protein VFC68_07515 [Treponemataceae bacterium]|nr:hypothetical protein [Treponemataceae bacterium]
MICIIRNLNAASYTSYINTSLNGKLAVPVAPQMVMYAQLEHIAGVASDSGHNGVSMSKIRILNTLIHNLTEMKQNAVMPEDTTTLTETQVEALINEYEKQITTTLSQTKANPYVLQGGAPPPSGSLFSIAS